MPALGLAAPPCGDRDAVIASLEERFGETPVARGLVDGKVMLEVLAAPDGSTWTLLATGADGGSCLVHSGKHWQALPPVPRGDPA